MSRKRKRIEEPEAPKYDLWHKPSNKKRRLDALAAMEALEAEINEIEETQQNEVDGEKDSQSQGELVYPVFGDEEVIIEEDGQFNFVKDMYAV